MGYEAFLTVGSMFIVVSMIGFKWGLFERAATDYIDSSMGG